MQDAFANARENKQGKWQKLSNGNFFKTDTPTIQNYHDIKVSSNSSNPDGSNIDVNTILKIIGYAHNWQKSFKADTPTVQNYRDVQVSNSNSNYGSG
ncbi:hypothetical protein DPMN_047279 [Dreissena polymorpha]|uniref:Uncharacterized protein n=1 Tax=Dreissena polymorpha TaxID=45954 RepID=A0A9D4I1C2_DREPO|nr:hypothetical protein DPMN_047279 [Dreissena polymorpha]